MTDREPFKSPSRLWLWLIASYSIFSSSWTIVYSYSFFRVEVPSQDVRWKLVAGVIMMFFSLYWVAAYRYLHWAAAKKNILYQLGKTHPNVLYIQFNRIFLRETILKEHNLSSNEFKGIQQKDFKEVMRKL